MFEDIFHGSLRNENEEKKERTATAAISKPPETRQEWMKEKGLTKWPLNLDGDIDVEKDPDDKLDSLSNIEKDLMESAPWDTTALETVDEELRKLEERLLQLMEKFLYDQQKASESVSENGGLRITSRRDPTGSFANSDLITAMYKQENNETSGDDTKDEKDAKKVIYNDFVGNNIAPALPNKVEPLPILDTVTKLQQFKLSFLRRWRPFFFCDSSCIILQCAFWWIWMEYFKPDKEQQARLFTLMADRYSLLLLSTDLITKDEILQYYPQCLSQAVFSAFCHAFPKSTKLFYSEDFLQLLCNNIHEWITGIPSSISCWNTWSMKELERSKSMEISQSESSMTESESRDDHKTVTISKEDVIASRQPSTQMKSSSKTNKQSITSGPTLECVRFATTSKSPLLQHHMLLHGLEDKTTVTASNKPIVTRTQIKELPTSTVSLEELIKTSQELSEKRHKDYQRQMEQYQQQLSEIVMENKLELHNMQKETKKLLDQKHEVTVQAEKIMAKYCGPNQSVK